MKNLIKFIFSFQFSKLLIIFETSIVAYLTYEGVSMAKMCIAKSFTGSLPWVATMVTSAWAAYGVSVAHYYSKGKAEQVKKIEMFGSEMPINNIDYGGDDEDGESI
jgi:hypothetical protein